MGPWRRQGPIGVSGTPEDRTGTGRSEGWRVAVAGVRWCRTGGAVGTAGDHPGTGERQVGWAGVAGGPAGGGCASDAIGVTGAGDAAGGGHGEGAVGGHGVDPAAGVGLEPVVPPAQTALLDLESTP